jgi:hypothetical protein
MPYLSMEIDCHSLRQTYRQSTTRYPATVEVATVDAPI